MDFYLFSAFLVLMTTQSVLQYSFTFNQSHTHSYSASISSTLLFYEAQFGVQHLAQGFGKTGDQTADLQVGGRPLYPLSHSRPTGLAHLRSKWAVCGPLTKMSLTPLFYMVWFLRCALQWYPLATRVVRWVCEQLRSRRSLFKREINKSLVTWYAHSTCMFLGIFSWLLWTRGHSGPLGTSMFCAWKCILLLIF